MEHITKTIGILCVMVMTIGILNDMGSFPASEKVIKFVTAICIMIAFFKTISATEFELKIEYPYSQTFDTQQTQYLKEAIVSETQAGLEQLIQKRLDEKNISYNSVTVHILEQNGSISVDEISICCGEEYENEIKSYIYDVISEDTKILIGE